MSNTQTVTIAETEGRALYGYDLSGAPRSLVRLSIFLLGTCGVPSKNVMRS
jgi:hypothetical protein